MLSPARPYRRCAKCPPTASRIAGTAQSHLNKQDVGSGDVFLFFGLYRRVEKTAQGWHFVKGAPELHLLWGWLQVDQKYRVADLGQNDLP